MARRNGYNWEALREEWVERRLSGEPLDRKDFAAEKSIPYATLRRHSGAWQDRLDEREADVQAVVKDRTTIDHAAMRIAILEEREPLRKFFMEQVARWLKAMEEDEDERVELREVIQLGNLLIKMGEVGAGLPKEHVVRHDEVHEGVAANRQQMLGLEGAVVELARWKREKRKAKAAREKA